MKKLHSLRHAAVLFMLVTLVLCFAQIGLAKEKVVFWTSHTGAVDRAAIEKIVAEYNKSQDTYEAEIVFVPGSETDVAKLMTAVAAGTGPDAYLIDRFTTAQRAVAGALTDMTPLIERSGWDAASEFLDFAWKEANWAGRTYALPFDTDTRALYYRKDHFREAGLNPDNPPATIAELDQVNAKLTTRVGRRYQRIGIIPWLGQGWHYTWGWAFGGEFYDPVNRKITANHPAIVESFAWQQKVATEYGAAAIQSFSSAFGSEAQDAFIAGKVSMIIDGDWRIANMDRFGPDVDYGIANIPTANNAGPVTWAGGWAMVIPRGAKNVDGGFDFAKFFCGPVGQEIYAKQTSHLPTLKALVEVENFFDDEGHMWFLHMLPFAKSRPALPVGALLWDELTAARDYVINGEKSPEQALNDVNARVQPELDKYLQ